MTKLEQIRSEVEAKVDAAKKRGTPKVSLTKRIRNGEKWLDENFQTMIEAGGDDEVKAMRWLKTYERLCDEYRGKYGGYVEKQYDHPKLL